MEKFGKFIAALLMIGINLTLMMFTLATLWGWFIVPLGLPAIGWAHAYGLSMFIVFFQARSKISLKPEMINKLTIYQQLGKGVGYSLGTLLFGYLASLFM